MQEERFPLRDAEEKVCLGRRPFKARLGYTKWGYTRWTPVDGPGFSVAPTAESFGVFVFRRFGCREFLGRC